MSGSIAWAVGPRATAATNAGGCRGRLRTVEPVQSVDLNCNQLIPMGYKDSSGFGGGPLSYMLVRVSKSDE